MTDNNDHKYFTRSKQNNKRIKYTNNDDSDLDWNPEDEDEDEVEVEDEDEDEVEVKVEDEDITLDNCPAPPRLRRGNQNIFKKRIFCYKIKDLVYHRGFS